MNPEPSSLEAVVCLSPHLDDAVLSCGGLLARCREQGQPTRVITFFTADSPPAEALTPFALELHQSWGNPPNPMAQRREEDGHALDVLGCEKSWWHYLDAIYRHPAYNSREALFGQPAEEPDLEEELLQRCGAIPARLLLFPLAIGHHVDHQLIFRVGWKLAQSDQRVAFYEDLPYVAWEGSPEPRLQELYQPLYAQTLTIDRFWPTKLEAIQRYASQIDALAHEGVPLRQALEQYACSIVPSEYTERLWWPEEGQWI